MIKKQGLNPREHKIMMHFLAIGEKPEVVSDKLRVSIDYVNQFMERKRTRKIPDMPQAQEPETLEMHVDPKPKKRRGKTHGNE